MYNNTNKEIYMIGNISNRELQSNQKIAVVFGGCGFIGHHLARRLREEGYWVRVVDIKVQEYCEMMSFCDDFILGDLTNIDVTRVALNLGRTDVEVYQLAADMGGAEYLFSGENDANVMSNSVLINVNALRVMTELNLKRVFFSSSACVYPEENQLDPENPNCEEGTVYPAHPDSEYGWEKLFGERLYLAYHKNYGIEPRIARFHNIYGPEGTWGGGKEKAPAALCRKIASTKNHETIEMFGDGKQTRSFLYVDECVEGIVRLMWSDVRTPINIGSEELISINDLAHMIMNIANKPDISIHHISGPVGVRGRCSDNKLIASLLGWKPNYPLEKGITKTYNWIAEQVKASI